MNCIEVISHSPRKPEVPLYAQWRIYPRLRGSGEPLFFFMTLRRSKGHSLKFSAGGGRPSPTKLASESARCTDNRSTSGNSHDWNSKKEVARFFGQVDSLLRTSRIYTSLTGVYCRSTLSQIFQSEPALVHKKRRGNSLVARESHYKEAKRRYFK